MKKPNFCYENMPESVSRERKGSKCKIQRINYRKGYFLYLQSISNLATETW